jgi:predicted ATPase/class 3 adenylate cyclase/regulation of enolase protein 1 (concanavalin A-like superfamily)
MRCSKCQTDNREGRKFCRQCGAKLGWKCPDCGYDNEADDKFCGGCGKALEDASQPQPIIHTISEPVVPPKLSDMQDRLYIPEPLKQQMDNARQEISGENRLVTALFADISGFTPMSQQLTPESVVDRVNQCFRIITDSVYRYEGSINKFIGDCVLAFFGAPLVHENDAERAILAALSMRKDVSEIGLSISVGINTGMMYFGPVGTEQHQEITAYGHDVNLAKRLQESADTGEIIVGRTTYGFTRRAFEFELKKDLSLKGISEPVRAYSVLKVAEHPEKVRGIEGLRARLVGRDKEFAMLLDSVNRLTEERQGQIVSIIGEAGIGKSRLIAELKGTVADKNVRWLEGRCISIGQSISYWPFLDILRDYLQISSDDDGTTIAVKIEAEMRQLFGQSASEVIPYVGNLLSVKLDETYQQKLQYLTPEHLRRQTLLRLRDIVVALARQKPLILVLEDLHWADDVSLDALWLLLDELPMMPLLLLCVYRPETEHRSWQLGKVALQKALERYTEIHLRPLSERESRQLIESLLTIENLPTATKNIILTKADGNPFFVEEIIRSLLEMDLIYHEAGRWKAREEITSIHVPDTIQSVILARVDRLADETKQVLQCASIIGRMFRYRLLNYVSHQEHRLNSHLGQLEDYDLVYEERRTPELEYAFKHALTQEATYQGILERHRREFHLRVAQGIETLYHERIQEYYEELAYHYTKSDDKSKALEYLTKAGKKCFDSYAMPEANRYYTEAINLAHQVLDLSSQSDKEKMAELYQQRGAQRGVTGMNTMQDYKEALKYTERKDLRAMLYGEIARFYQWERRDGKTGRYYANLGRAELEGADESRWAVEAYNAIGTIIAGTVDVEELEAFFYKGVEIAQRIGYKEGLLDLYTHILMMVHSYQDDSIFEKLLTLTKEVENPYALTRGYLWIAVRHQVHDNTLEAIEYFQKAVDIGEKYDSGAWTALAYGGFGGSYEKVNELDKALDAYEKCWKMSLKLRYFLPFPGTPNRLSRLYQQRGEAHKMLGMVEDFLDMMDKIMAEEETEEDSPFFQFVETFEYTAIVQSDELRLKCQQRLEAGLERAVNRMEVIWYLYQLMDFHLACENLDNTKRYACRLVEVNPRIGRWMLKPLVLIDDVKSANQLVLDILQSASRSPDEFTDILWNLEMLYKRLNHHQTFRQICQQFQHEHSEALQKLGLVQLYLEPAQPSAELGGRGSCQATVDAFDGDALSSTWKWIDPQGDCKCEMVSPSGVQIIVPQPRTGYFSRLLQAISGDFAIETRISDGEGGVKSGGLMVWKDEDNQIRFNGPSSFREGEVRLGTYVNGKYIFHGRGLLDADTFILRLERQGHCFCAYCSVDGENWLTCGWVDWPMEDPIQVGIYAFCASPPATSTRFEYFKILRRDLS